MRRSSTPMAKSILTLQKDDFRVFEDGVPQTIASFRHEDLPISLGILIDSSGSMYDKRAAVEQAALDLIRLSNKDDEAFVVDFSWEAFTPTWQWPCWLQTERSAALDFRLASSSSSVLTGRSPIDEGEHGQPKWHPETRSQLQIGWMKGIHDDEQRED